MLEANSRHQHEKVRRAGAFVNLQQLILIQSSGELQDIDDTQKILRY